MKIKEIRWVFPGGPAVDSALALQGALVRPKKKKERDQACKGFDLCLDGGC